MKKAIMLIIALALSVLLFGGGLPVMGEISGRCTDGPSDVRNPNTTDCADMLARAICGAHGSEGGWCDAVFGR